MKQHLSHTPGPIGVFDSGYGGLTILNKIREALPEYDYIYLGDNARTPYGTRSLKSYTNSLCRQSINCLKWDVISLSWPAIQPLPKHCAAYK